MAPFGGEGAWEKRGFLDRDNQLEHVGRSWIPFTEIPNQIAIVFGNDPFGDEALLNLTNEIGPSTY